jgi:alkaline phosphatase D
MPDGPTKTILGNEQKEWLKRTLAESTATFKLVFSPTPIVGPDRPSKSDNHANKVFEFEGNELRQLFGATDDLLVFCGDRHWQYASLDTDLNLWEFGCGPGSQNHELGWKQNDIRLEHRFLRVQGGFLSGTLNYDDNGNPKLVIGHHDVQGRQLSNFPFLPHDNNSHDDSE